MVAQGLDLQRTLSPDFTYQVRLQGSGYLNLGQAGDYNGFIQWNTDSGVTDETATYRRSDCAVTATGICARAMATGAVALQRENRVVPLGSTVYIEDLNLQITIEDTGGGVGRYQIDVYVGIGRQALNTYYTLYNVTSSRVWVLEPNH